MSRLPKNIETKIERITESGCWIWTGASNRYGSSYHNGKTGRAHRVVYEILVGKIPDGLELLHSCDIGICVNPAHLKPGTHQDNMNDMVKKGRSKSGGYGDDHWTRKSKEKAIEIARQNIRKAHKSGFENNNAKVTQEIIQGVRNLKSENHTLTFTEIGNRYGIGRETARKIIRGILWK